jgi:hypothetical protein
MSIKFADDMTAKQFTAVNYRYKKLLEEKDNLVKRGYVYIIISSILLSFILITKSLTIVDYILDCFYVSCMISLPLWLLFVLIINEYFKERIEKETYRFVKMSKEKRGWVIH